MREKSLKILRRTLYRNVNSEDPTKVYTVLSNELICPAFSKYLIILPVSIESQTRSSFSLNPVLHPEVSKQGSSPLAFYRQIN